MTPEARENELISQATDLAERQIQDGTVSSQVLVHYLRLGTQRERLEREKLQNDNLLRAAQVDSLRSAQRVEELMDDALRVFRYYQGEDPEDEEVQGEW
jgi:hypothetical protein